MFQKTGLTTVLQNYLNYSNYQETQQRFDANSSRILQSYQYSLNPNKYLYTYLQVERSARLHAKHFTTREFV